MTKSLLMIATGAAALLAASPAFAGTASTTIASILNVQDGCQVNVGGSSAASALLLYPTVQNAAVQQADLLADTGAGAVGISILCNVNYTTATTQIDGGLHASGAVRQLVNAGIPPGPGSFVKYGLFNSAGRTSGSAYQIGVPQPFAGTGVLTAGVQNFDRVFGLILANDVVAAVAGQYTDAAQYVVTF